MQKLTITYKTPEIGTDKDGKPVIQYKTETELYVVASTKSQNNLLDELKADNKVASDVLVENLFLDKKAVLKLFSDYIGTAITDKTIATAVIEHTLKALDGACLFEKPKAVKSK